MLPKTGGTNGGAGISGGSAANLIPRVRSLWSTLDNGGIFIPKSNPESDAITARRGFLMRWPVFALCGGLLPLIVSLGDPDDAILQSDAVQATREAIARLPAHTRHEIKLNLERPQQKSCVRGRLGDCLAAASSIKTMPAACQSRRPP